MKFLRNIFILSLVLGLLTVIMWFLFTMSGQVEKRFRKYLGDDICKDWQLHGLKQEGLKTFSAREIVIPAEPVIEERDLLLISHPEISTGKPVLSGFDGQPLKFISRGGEIHLEESNNVWNCAGVGRKLLEIGRRGLIKEFVCEEGVFLLTIKRVLKKQNWSFQLRNLHMKAGKDAVIDLMAQVYRSDHPDTWERGALEAQIMFKPLRFLVTFNAYNFPGVPELVDLFVGHVEGVNLDGEGNLTLNGRTDNGITSWEGKFQASDLSMEFPGTGILLENLEGMLIFRKGRINWSFLTGTIGGVEMNSTGELLLPFERETLIRLDFSSVRLSSAWLRLVGNKRLRNFFSNFRPRGILSGSLFLKNMLVPSQEKISAVFSGEKFSMGKVMVFDSIQIKGEIADKRLQKGNISWDSLEMSGCRMGPGFLEVQEAGTDWTITKCSFGCEKGKTVGQGKFVNGEKPALSLKLIPCEINCSDLFKIIRFKPFFNGKIIPDKGSVDIRYEDNGLLVQGILRLKDVSFGTFIGGLKKYIPGDEKLGFSSGKINFLLSGENLTLKPALFFSGSTIMVLRGTITSLGFAKLKIMVLEREKLIDDVIFASDPATWPLSEKQRSNAVHLELDGPVTGEVRSSSN